MVEVFKTNITDYEAAHALAAELRHYYPHCLITFDLEDCDKILRLKGDVIYTADIVSFLTGRGFACEALE